MKDLYHRLGLSNDTADENELRAAIGLADTSDIRAAAEHILLSSRRRRVYDRNRRVLVLIGRLRAELDLREGAFWKECRCRDFNYKPGTSATGTRRHGTGPPPPPPRSQAPPKPRPRRTKPSAPQRRPSSISPSNTKAPIIVTCPRFLYQCE